MNSDTTKNVSSEKLKNDVLNQIDKVDSDIDQIQHRLTPGKIIDDAIFESKGRNLERTFKHLKENPIGTSFLTMGTIMLMESDDSRSYEAVARDKISSGSSKIRKTVTDKSESVKSSLYQAKAKVSDKMDAASRKLDSVKSKAEVPEGVMSQMGSQVQNMDSSTLMAIGAGLGALTSASLPVSEKESELVSNVAGESIESFRQELREALNESTRILKDRVLGDLKDIPINF
jgi:hypothetical protein